MKKKMIMVLLALTVLTNAGVTTLIVQNDHNLLICENKDVPRFS